MSRKCDMEEESIVACPHCGAQNRIGTAPPDQVPVCGRCSNSLPWIVNGTDIGFRKELQTTLPVLVDFWASWCAPCADEAPILERVHKRLQARNAGTVLGATYSDSPSASRRFERRYRITYPSVRDVDTELAEQYGTRNLPETFVLDREGRIVAVSRGQVSQEFLDRAIAKAERT